MITLNSVSCGYTNILPIRNLSVTLPDQGVVAVLGPSGSGKSTLLKLLAGLLVPKEGKVVGLERKKASMVFQEDRLLPWYTALENVTLVCKNRELATSMLEQVELMQHLSVYPDALSGGMQRRVAIARALAFGGDMLLLDEPFQGLDAELKTRLTDRMRRMFPLIVIATHQRNEAEALGLTQTIELA